MIRSENVWQHGQANQGIKIIGPARVQNFVGQVSKVPLYRSGMLNVVAHCVYQR